MYARLQTIAVLLDRFAETTGRIIAWLTLALATWSGRLLRILPVDLFWLLLVFLAPDPLVLGHVSPLLYLAALFQCG